MLSLSDLQLPLPKLYDVLYIKLQRRRLDLDAYRRAPAQVLPKVAASPFYYVALHRKLRLISNWLIHEAKLVRVVTNRSMILSIGESVYCFPILGHVYVKCSEQRRVD